MSAIIHRRVARVAALCAVAAMALGSASCGDVSRSGQSPSTLVIDQLTASSGADPSQFGNTLQSDVLTNGSTIGQATCIRIGASLKAVQGNLSESVPNTLNWNNGQSRLNERILAQPSR